MGRPSGTGTKAKVRSPLDAKDIDRLISRYKISIVTLLEAEGFSNKEEKWLSQAKFWASKPVAALLRRGSAESGMSTFLDTL
jgi:hypothetical protein